MNTRPARTALPADGQKSLRVWFRAEEAAVVLTVRAVVCAAAPVIVTEEGTLHVAGSFAAKGVIAQLRLIAPVNPPEGVKVMVEALPVAAPATTVMAVPLTLKLGGAVIT